MSDIGSGEPWELERPHGHFYAHGADFAHRTLGDRRSRCLVIGSPLFEARELRAAGWDVTYLDIRKPPVEIGWVEGDATAIPFPSAYFDAISSSCVVCHVGLGRYGDPVADGSDARMLTEIARVLKPGGLAALTFGPIGEKDEVSGISHRLYTLAGARKLLPPELEEVEHEVLTGGERGYLSMLLRRI